MDSYKLKAKDTKHTNGSLSLSKEKLPTNQSLTICVVIEPVSTQSIYKQLVTFKIADVGTMRN